MNRVRLNWSLYGIISGGREIVEIESASHNANETEFGIFLDFSKVQVYQICIGDHWIFHLGRTSFGLCQYQKKKEKEKEIEPNFVSIVQNYSSCPYFSGDDGKATLFNIYTL